jgi:geranylgeranyl diphosphate synthase type II
MEFIPIYTNYIEEELKKIDIPSSPKGLYDPVRYFLDIGGKRMRPILTLLGAELFGLEKEQVIQTALAVEVLHNFTLIHDDIMDNAPLRRGNVTVHEKWDTSTAILSGDILMIKAYQLLEKQEGDLRLLLKSLNRIMTEICEGQQMDMDFEVRSDITVGEYIEMIRLKTSVLLGGALELAAIIAGTSEKNKERIYQFGVNIGLAFQIQDDILDLYADPEKFGKQVGGDVVANKKTILSLLAKDNSTPSQLDILKELETEDNLSDKIAKTKRLFDELNIKQKSLDLVNHYFNLAQEEMNKIDIPLKNKQRLTELSIYLLNREV